MPLKTRTTLRPRARKPLTIEVFDKSYQAAAEILLRSSQYLQPTDLMSVRPPGVLRPVNE